MKKILVFTALFTFFATFTTFAEDNVRIVPIKESSTIELQLQAERWVNTSTALVTISSDATLEKGNLTQTREQMLNKINSLIDKINWSVTVFNTAQSESGLEQLHVEAQARIPEDKLNNLRDKAKEVSKPGLTIRVVSVDFSPSLVELEQAKAQLREQIYNDAKNEIEQINKMYPGQNYVLRSIVFQSAFPPPPVPLNMVAFSSARVRAPASGGENAILSVSTKIQIFATVRVATAGGVFGHSVIVKD